MGSLVSETGSLLGGGNNNSQTTAQGAGGAGTSTIQNPVTEQQAKDAYGNVQAMQGQQTDLASALAAQNGIQNQSAALTSQQQLAQALQQANGVGNTQSAAAGFQGIANGTGPNLAGAQLNNATGQNVAN